MIKCFKNSVVVLIFYFVFCFHFNYRATNLRNYTWNVIFDKWLKTLLSWGLTKLKSYYYLGKYESLNGISWNKIFEIRSLCVREAETFHRTQ